VKRSWICLLTVLAIVASGALVACGGGSSKSNNNAAPTTAPQQQGSTPAAEATSTKQPTASSSGSSGGSAGSLSDVPVYPGATKVNSGEFSGSSASIPAIGSSLNAADYKHVAYGIYETDDSPQTVFDWYKSHMSGWTDEGSFSGGSGGDTGAFAAWSKDSGKEAAWMTVGSSSGKTSLSIWVGTP
jgi:hypothetical protein